MNEPYILADKVENRVFDALYGKETMPRIFHNSMVQEFKQQYPAQYQQIVRQCQEEIRIEQVPFQVGQTVKFVNSLRTYVCYQDWAKLHKPKGLNWEPFLLAPQGKTGVLRVKAIHGRLYPLKVLYGVEIEGFFYILDEQGLMG